MIVLLPPGGALMRPASTDVSDLTASKRTGPARFTDDEGRRLEIPFDPEPSASERARIRVRLLTRDAAEEARFVDLQAALDALKDDPSPYAVALRALMNMQLRRVA